MTPIVSKLTLAVALLAGATSAFAAAPRVDVPTVAVRYDDLNLSTATGVSTLYRRISSAARQVCPDGYSRNPIVLLAAQRCQSDAVAKAVSEVNNTYLAMLHATRVAHG